MIYTHTGAKFSSDRIYRYVLWRVWDASKPWVMFIGLNPSVAAEREDDRTIKRCVSFAESWDFGRILMTNLFAFCATKRIEMKQAANPVGPQNDRFL